MPLNSPDPARETEETQRPSLPVTIISGFLGSGKTTLLNYILSEDHGSRVGVLVNDFGAINIDAKLIVGVEGETVNLANGCVCCSIRDDLVAACLGMLQRAEPPDQLIIETSGVSDPVEVANTFLMPELQPFLSLNCIIGVVDAEQLPSLTDELGVLARQQIRVADMVVLNKVDLVGTEALAKVRALVHQIAPGSRIFETHQARVPLKLMLGAGLDEAGMQHPVACADPVDHADSHNHDFDHPFSTWHWSCDQPLSLPRLRRVVESLPNTIYRAKGIVCLEELPTYQIALQMVGKRTSLADTALWGSQPPRSEIVLIASRGGINSEALQAAFENCIGTGDESQSPILRLKRLLETSPAEIT
ncbi:putative metal chaperone YciC [Planctomycetes bacterium CA13]|uniref:Putative metal chaperone YciC n=1 Tax=Novipirellula herctigrandis TaxID=2527986 RepID=A0A5C5Z3Y9_9BACT|nr:putative metal chaperone YciC [Planctomycetes bacterium CA13]